MIEKIEEGLKPPSLPPHKIVYYNDAEGRRKKKIMKLVRKEK